MQRRVALLVMVAMLGASVARAEAPSPTGDPRPPTGWVGIGVGIGGFVWAFSQAATIPFCFADFYPTEPEYCLGASAVLGAGALAVGLTGILMGMKRRAAYKEWRTRELERRSPSLTGLDVGFAAGSGSLRVRVSF
jgi:hypothetical protein